MKLILLATLVSTINCFANQWECKVELSSNVDRQELLQIDADVEKKIPKMEGPAYALCKVGPRVAVLIQDVGSGLYVYNMRIYVKADKKWAVVKSSRMSTGNAQKSPAKVTLDHHVVTVYSRDDQVIDTFDISEYLD